MILSSIPGPLRFTAMFSLSFMAVLFLTVAVSSQKNNPYSPSPDGKATATPQQRVAGEITVSVFPARSDGVNPGPAVARRIEPVNKTVSAGPAPPNDIYNIGVGDVLFVDLKNSQQGSGYYTVRADGTIDYPLAGENVRAAGTTVDDLQENLMSRIKLYANPKVEVKVREYASHKVTVSGLVDAPGEKSLQREAVPLYVIKAASIVTAAATRAMIKHGPGATPQLFDLKDSSTDSILIFPGDQIEFMNDLGSKDPKTAVYFIGGDITSGGPKQLLPGMTLYQALVASGGAKGDPRKAIIRRKNSQGMLAVSEHNLRAIRDGKAVDPTLAAGDVVEIRN